MQLHGFQAAGVPVQSSSWFHGNLFSLANQRPVQCTVIFRKSPSSTRDLRLHDDLHRRFVTGQRSAASQALSLLPPHPLSFLRHRLVGVSTRSSHYQDPAGLYNDGSFARQQGCFAHTACSQGVLTRRAHTRCTHNSTPHVAAAPASSLLLRPRLVPTRSSRLPRCRGRKGAGCSFSV